MELRRDDHPRKPVNRCECRRRCLIDNRNPFAKRHAPKKCSANGRVIVKLKDGGKIELCVECAMNSVEAEKTLR